MLVTQQLEALIKEDHTHPVVKAFVTRLGAQWMDGNTVEGIIASVHSVEPPSRKIEHHPRETEPQIEITVSVTEQEYGRCSYSVGRFGRGTIPVPRRLFEDNDEDEIIDYINDNYGNYIETEQGNDYEYDGYETDGIDDCNVEIEDDIEGMISAVLDEMNEE